MIKQNSKGDTILIITGRHEKVVIDQGDGTERTVLLRDVEVGEQRFLSGQAVTFLSGKVVNRDGTLKEFGPDHASRYELIQTTIIKSRTPMTLTTNLHYGDAKLTVTK
jgi:hypothetical protein|tara:strand:- start:140 stop:463 length:324 start_codon:yes stop_codon:yes gene_type:complete